MDNSVNKGEFPNNEVDLLDYLITFAKHSRMIIFTSMAAMFLTYAILFILPNKYTATARLLPPQQNQTLSGQILDSLGGGGGISSSAGGVGMGIMGGMAANLLGIKSLGELYVGMLTSDTVFDNIIDQFKLKKIYKVNYIEQARKELGKKAKIAVNKKDGIISIEVTSKSPEQSAKMANAFIKELDRLMEQMAVQEAKERLTFLEKERQQANQNLQQAEDSLRCFSEKNSVLQIDTQTRGVLEYIARLRAEIDSKEVGIQVLRQQATPLNSDMIQLETEVRGLKEKLRTLETRYDNNVPDVCLPTSKAPGLALEYFRLYREAKFQEGLYQLYVKLVEITRLDMLRDNAVIKVLDCAKPPEKRSNSRALPSIIVGMVTFVLMIFVTFGREHLFTDEKDVQRLSMIKHYLKPWGDMLKRVKKMLGFKIM